MIDPSSGFIIDVEEVENESNNSGVSVCKKRVWRESDKKEWLKIYEDYMQKRSERLPQPLDFRHICCKEFKVGRDGIKVTAATSRQLKRDQEHSTLNNLESGMSIRVKTVRELNFASKIVEHDSNKDLQGRQLEQSKEHMDSDSLTHTKKVGDMTVDIMIERIGEGSDCHTKGTSEIKGLSKKKLGRIKSPFKTKRFMNLKNNAIKIVQYSNVCLFKMIKHYFICYVCREWFQDMQMLRSHVLGNHTYRQVRRQMVEGTDMIYNADITDLKCNRCSLALVSLSELRDHLITHNVKFKRGGCALIPYKVCAGTLTCQHCDEVFETTHLLQKHMAKHLSFIDSYARIRKDKTCETTLDYVSHEPMPDKARFKCYECSQKFRYDYKRIQHIIEKHNTKSKLFQCTFCPRIFMTVHWLTKHMNSVHKEMSS